MQAALFPIAEVNTLKGDRPTPEDDAGLVCAKLIPKQQMGSDILLHSNSPGRSLGLLEEGLLLRHPLGSDYFSG